MKGFLIKLAKQDKLKFIEPNENVFLSYSEKSLSNLESARILLDNNKFEEAVSFVYYSMYNLVLALLYKAGIKSENHSASIVLLKKVFGFENKLILEAKTERIDKQYYVGFSVFKKEVQEGIEIAESFNRELKGFISGINRGDIEEYRDKLRDLLKWKKKIKEKMEKKILNFILQEGEGQYIEFKERLGLDFSKEIVAFANSSGGKIFLGVDDKNIVKGIEITNKLKSQIQDIAKNCDPSIEIELESVEGKGVLVVSVEEGKNKPYSCKEGFYLRMNANSQKMTPRAYPEKSSKKIFTGSKRDEIMELAVKEGKIRFDEQICKDFDWKDFDSEKFEYYLKLAGLSNNLGREDMLKNLKILTREGFTNAGVLFFSKNPYKYLGNSKVRCVHFRGDERINILDKKEIDKGIVGNIEFAISYLEDRVPVEFRIRNARREEFPEYVKEAYREIIVNAIVHRDYFIDAEVAVEKLKNKIFITNPGESFVSKEDLGKDSKFRNRLIADLLSKTIFMEKVGTGINRVKDFCARNNNNVEFDVGETSFRVNIFSNKLGLQDKNVPKNVPKKLSSEERRYNILEKIRLNEKFTKRSLSIEFGIDIREIQRDLDKLKNKIEFVGSKREGHWRIKNE